MWDFGPLREDVKAIYGREQVKLIQPCLNSIWSSRGFARFHFQEAIRLMGDAVGEQEFYSHFDLIAGFFERDQGEFESQRFKAEAHIISCVNAMHSLADILGQTIYLSLAMNLDPAKRFKKDRAINLESVAKKLGPGELSESVSELVDHDDFRYIASMNNHSKHRSIVPVGFSIDLSGQDTQSHGLKFSELRYDDQIFPARWVEPTLKSEYERQEALIMKIGNALNDELAARRLLLASGEA